MPALADFAAPSSFQRFINHDLYPAASLNKDADQQLEQQAAYREAGPASSIEHLVEQSEIRIVVQAHLLESGSDSAPTASQESANHQNEHLAPGRTCESWLKMSK